MREIAVQHYYLRTIRGVPDRLTDLHARIYTLEGPGARAGVAPDPTADCNIRLQSVEQKVAQFECVPQDGHSATLPTRGGTLREADCRSQATVEQCVRQHCTVFNDRFKSLEQEVTRCVASVEFAQASWQATSEVTPPPDPTVGRGSVPLDHRVC